MNTIKNSKKQKTETVLQKTSEASTILFIKRDKHLTNYQDMNLINSHFPQTPKSK